MPVAQEEHDTYTANLAAYEAAVADLEREQERAEYERLRAKFEGVGFDDVADYGESE